VDPLEGEVEEEELADLLSGLKVLVRPATSNVFRLSELTQGEENVGMAMTFTLVSHLREQLAELVRSRAEKERRLAAEKERLELEVGHLLASPNGTLQHRALLGRGGEDPGHTCYARVLPRLESKVR